MLCSGCSTHVATGPSGLCTGCSAGGTAPGWAPPAPVRSLVGLSYAVVVLLVLVAVTDLAAIFATLNVRAVVGDLLAAPVELFEPYSDAERRADQLMYFSASFQFMVFIATCIVFIVWFHRARTNAGALAPDAQLRGRGWAIGSWFIPIANLWIPRQIAGDIWTASELDGRASRAVLNAWWAAWVVTFAVGRAADRFWQRAEDGDAIRKAAMGLVLSHVVDIVAVVLAILFVRRLTGMQQAKASAVGQPGGAVRIEG